MSTSRLEDMAREIADKYACSVQDTVVDGCLQMARAVIAEAERMAVNHSYLDFPNRKIVSVRLVNVEHLRSLDAPRDPCPGCGRHDPYCDCSAELKQQYKPKEGESDA